MTEIGETRRQVARAAAAAFGGNPTVARYYDEDESHSIDIVTCVDRPADGLVSYSTVGLSESPNLLDATDVRVELAGIAPVGVEAFPNLLATAAFAVMKEDWLAAPGVVFPSLVLDYELSSTLEHVLFVPPFLWEELGSVEVSDGATVHWLVVMPIAESERLALVDQGYDALDAVFAEHEADLADLERAPLA